MLASRDTTFKSTLRSVILTNTSSNGITCPSDADNVPSINELSSGWTERSKCYPKVSIKEKLRPVNMLYMIQTHILID
ncbi:hypothetical protein KUTeg_012610 [Tegillarca granosa]|uniref:Uncharacterized protein n=1 Tax=Tegillarca granosa TaxID=220873 RepID=A0ABQ9EZZ4_TEGGR|nr:hypothetical protein KUTeg_012610 [Tegillarca granosa]